MPDGASQTAPLPARVQGHFGPELRSYVLYQHPMKRGLDVLLGLEHADPDRVAVTGLSGGGWQTIFISAADYTHLTAMLAPQAAAPTA